MIIAVTGSRFAVERLHRPRIETVIRWLAGDHRVDELVHGCARGVDTIARDVVASLGRPVRGLPADWTGPCRKSCKPGHRKVQAGGDYCPAAGNYRNQEIIDGKPDVLLAFPLMGMANRGTIDCRDRALAAGIPTLIFPLEQLAV